MEEDNCNNRPHNRFEHVTFETIIYVLDPFESYSKLVYRKLLRPTVRHIRRFFPVLLPPFFLCRAFRRRKRTKFPSAAYHFGQLIRAHFVEASGAHLLVLFFFFSATVLIPRNHFSCSRCCLWKNRGRERGSSNNMVKSFKRVPAT